MQSTTKRLLYICIGLLLFFLPILVFTSSPSTVSVFSEVVLAAPLQQTVPAASFVGSSRIVDESEGTTVVTVQLSDTYTSTVSVPFQVLNGTATQGSDFTVSSSPLTFAIGDLTKTITVTIGNDTTDESNENFYLRLTAASLGDPSLYEITIIDDDVAVSGSATPVYTDAYEPNNTLQEAYTTSSGVQLCNITLWPTGDLDYFRFVGKKGSYYIVSTDDLEAGVDTALKVYNPQGDQIASNDDYEVGDRRSQVTITANSDGYYYARIENRDPSDPADKTYCFEVEEIDPPTATPTNTPPPGETGDEVCEFNSTIETACTIGLDQTYTFNFVPYWGSPQDTDVFRVWMKPGIEYTCETTIPTGSLADTNIIFLNSDGGDFIPNLGNDDKVLGDLGSKLSYLSTYTGWLHVMVGPVNVPEFEESVDYTYELSCTSTTATATPTATATTAFVSGGSVPAAPTATPIVFPTFPPTPTPIDLSSLNTPLPPTPPVVQFQPLPTSTPLSGGLQTATVNVTIYYDQNENFMPELTEGVMDTAVSLYSNSTGELVAFGYTNEAGMLQFNSISVVGAVRVVVPFLNYTQIVTGDSANILVRIAPQPLPVGIP
jgi:hypothetical protein